jgi:hypothetical protein
MKTSIYSILSFFALTALTISCQPKKQTENPDPEPRDTVKKEYRIPMEDMKAMIDQYKKERQEIINSNDSLKKIYGDNFQDSRCAWFSLEEMKNFIAQVEKETREKNPDIKPDGLRIYYVVYPTKADKESPYIKSIVPEYRNHHSLVMVPTFYDEKHKESVDFDPSASKASRGLQGSVMSLSAAGGAGAGDANGTGSASVSALNHAALCPPGCPTSSGMLGQ